MPIFPILSTGAVAQYPLRRSRSYSTQVVRFVDGSEQRSRIFAQPLHTWHVRLELLSDTELTAIDDFFVQLEGGSGTFEFTDPLDGTVYPNCSLRNDQLAQAFEGPSKGRTEIVIQENRS